jgi:release factor glutamine methyltransferase
MRNRLRDADVESSELDARLLMQYVLGMSREELFLNSSEMVAESKVLLLNSCLERRLRREPVSRILGARSFWKSDFKISAETLDPRADSETLIEAALRIVPTVAKMHVLDLGTGSGCLLLSLLQEWPKARGVGVDISKGAVEIAAENADSLGLGDRSEFITADWNDLEFLEKFDVIVTNPPYIAEYEMTSLEPEVALYDPTLALIGGADGLDCYRSLANNLPHFLKAKGYVFLEIGHTQAAAVKDILEQTGFIVLEVILDLAKNDRCLVAKIKAV